MITPSSFGVFGNQFWRCWYYRKYCLLSKRSSSDGNHHIIMSTYKKFVTVGTETNVEKDELRPNSQIIHLFDYQFIFGRLWEMEAYPLPKERSIVPSTTSSWSMYGSPVHPSLNLSRIRHGTRLSNPFVVCRGLFFLEAPYFVIENVRVFDERVASRHYYVPTIAWSLWNVIYTEVRAT